MKLDTLKVEEVFSKPVVYKGCINDKCKKGKNKDGTPKCECGLGYVDRQFDAFSVKAEDGNFYQLKGWSTNKVKAGDEIKGTFSEREYTNKEGEKKTSIDFTIAKPVDQAQAENEELKAEIARLKGLDNAPLIGDEDIPF